MNKIVLLLGTLSIYVMIQCSEKMELVMVPIEKEVFARTLAQQLPIDLVSELKNRAIGIRIQDILDGIATYYKAGEQGSKQSVENALARIKALKDDPQFAKYFNNETFITAVLGMITRKLQDIRFRIPVAVNHMAEAIGAPPEWFEIQRPLEWDLLHATQKGELDDVKRLLEKGKFDETSKITIHPNINAVFDIYTGTGNNSRGGYTTPFIESIKEALYNGNFEIPQYLLDHGADINFIGGPWNVPMGNIFRSVEFHTTPLQLAIVLDDPRVVNWLVKRRARTDIKEEHDWTPKEYITGSEGYLRNKKALLDALGGKFQEK